MDAFQRYELIREQNLVTLTVVGYFPNILDFSFYNVQSNICCMFLLYFLTYLSLYTVKFIFCVLFKLCNHYHNHDTKQFFTPLPTKVLPWVTFLNRFVPQMANLIYYVLILTTFACQTSYFLVLSTNSKAHQTVYAVILRDRQNEAFDYACVYLLG